MRLKKLGEMRRGEALMGAGEGDWPEETIGVKRLHGRSLFA